VDFETGFIRVDLKSINQPFTFIQMAETEITRS